MKTLKDSFDEMMSPEYQAEMAERRKQQMAARHRSFNHLREQGLIVLCTSYTKCLDCGKVEGMQRLGCSCMDLSRCLNDPEYAKSIKGVVHGSFVVDSLNETSGHVIGGFVTNQELYDRLKAGERFHNGCGTGEDAREITLDMFGDQS